MNNNIDVYIEITARDASDASTFLSALHESNLNLGDGTGVMGVYEISSIKTISEHPYTEILTISFKTSHAAMLFYRDGLPVPSSSTVTARLIRD